MPESQRTIIPVAGGKGGVGKSFLTANLAVALARLGHETIVVDLDFGNSNLHHVLGRANTAAGVGDFLRTDRYPDLETLLVTTHVPGLRFLAGDGRMPFMANPTFAQKRRLLQHLERLSARFVLLDLSAGTSLNTLDCFRISPGGVVITTPESPSIMSLMVFLKNLALRSVFEGLKVDLKLIDVLQELYVQPIDSQPFRIDRFRSRLQALSPEAARRLEQIRDSVRPRLLYNMIDSADDLDAGFRIDKTLDSIGIEVEHFGYVPFDPAVRSQMRRGGAIVEGDPGCPAARAIGRIARRLVRFDGRVIDRSIERLRRTAEPPEPEATPAP